MSEEEPEECPACDGYGELPGNPNTNDFPTCSACNGTGLNQKNKNENTTRIL